jgi:hypothetical protein
VSLRLLAEACAIAAGVRIALRFVPVNRLVCAIARLPRGRSASSCASGFRPQAEGTSREDDQAIQACVTAAWAAAARIAHPTCLFTSLVAFGLLARRGHPAAIHIGASRDGGFAAHAWVTVNGRPFGPPQSRRYAALWWHRAAAAREA